MKAPVRVGVLVAHLNDSLQTQLWRSVKRRAALRRVSTVAFLGHGLQETEARHRTSTALYQLARAPLCDGLIVFSQSIGNHSGPEAVSELIRGLGLPAVSVGYDLPEVKSVRSDGQQALREVVNHLVTVHGRRHFALVTGPRIHPESAAREAAVRAELAGLGLDLAPSLVLDAEFSRERAEDLGGSLAWGEVDAVVCLNDHMAVGMVEALAKRGFRVPEDVSVVGFDDLPESQWRRPALTSVHQPLEPMGARAVDLLLGKDGESPSPEVLDCMPVYRRSCGCEKGRRTVSGRGFEETQERIDRQARLREIGVQLQGAFDRESLANQWALALDSLGFSVGDLVLKAGPVHRHERWSRGRGRESFALPNDALVLPDSWATVRSDWIVLPLVYQQEFLGCLVLSCDIDDSVVYETLRDQMSTAVKATALMEASLSHQRELEHTVERRTRDLRAANHSLKDEIRQRRELERVVQEVSNQTMQAIGQNIHDDLCQHLAGIGMLTSVLEARWAEGGTLDTSPLREIRSLIDRAGDRARQYSRTLYPPGLEEHGLVSALEDLIDNLRQSVPHLSITMQIEGTPEVDDQCALQLFRIAQELTANAVKHSGSDLVLVRVVGGPLETEIEVRDFGRGLPSPITGQGMGMRILQYRADSIGAQLTFQNLDPGLRATCRLPRAGGGKR